MTIGGPGSESAKSFGPTPSLSLRGGSTVAALTAAVAIGVMGAARLLGGSGREAAHPPVALHHTPAEVRPTPRVQPAIRDRPEEGLPPAANARARGADAAIRGLIDAQAGRGGSLYPRRRGAVAALPRWRLRRQGQLRLRRLMEAANAKAELGVRAALTRERLDARWARWRSRLPRFALMGVVLILSLVGLRDLIAPAEPVRASAGPAAVDPAADDFALQFARAYLSYDAAKPERRDRALAAFLPSSLDPDGGFTPARGSQSVLWAEVASNQPALAGGRVITVAAQTSGQEQPVYLAITVRHDPGRPLELVDYPSFVGAPSVARDPSDG